MLKVNKKIFFSSNVGEDINKLPVGVYTINVDAMGNIFLDEQNKMVYQDLYGESNDIMDIVLHYKNGSNKNFGCLFEGISGMGKTQTIKNLCVKMNLPVISITSPQHKDLILKVVEQINSDCIIFIDEFEKVYGEDEQACNSLLALFDGLNTKNRIISFVAFNDRGSLSNYFFNRPGRFIFNFKFSPLDDKKALEFIKSKVSISASVEKSLKYFLFRVENISYDILDKIIHVINIYGEKFPKAIVNMNLEKSRISYVMNIDHGEHSWASICSDPEYLRLKGVGIYQTEALSFLNPRDFEKIEDMGIEDEFLVPFEQYKEYLKPEFNSPKTIVKIARMKSVPVFDKKYFD